MSMKIGKEGFTDANQSGQNRDIFGLPVVLEDISPGKENEVILVQTPRGKNVNTGVKVPLLKDLDSRYVSRGQTSCRFDIVEKVSTVIKPGSYGPSHNVENMGDVKTLAGNADSSQRKLFISRQPTFHSTTTRSTEPKDIWEKISPYHWNQWLKNKEGDARDVLYKNTYCLGKELRYRSSTLPRIAQERPWSVGDPPKETPRFSKVELSDCSKTILTQQPRGTVVRFREYMRPYVHSSDGTLLEIKRFNDRVRQNHVEMNQGFPLIRQDSRRAARNERPMKFENSRYTKSGKGTLFNKHVVPVPYNGLFDRDYSSADTFKEYLESLKNNVANNMAGVHLRDRQLPSRESVDYHNKVLQSVKEVNQPYESDIKAPPATENLSKTNEVRSSITVEIKPSWQENDDASGTPRSDMAPKKGERAPTIDNLSSVHGSVVPANPKVTKMPISSSVVGGGSVDKVPRVISAANTLPDNKVSPRGSESGATCPVNTPTPDEEFVD